MSLICLWTATKPRFDEETEVSRKWPGLQHLQKIWYRPNLYMLLVPNRGNKPAGINQIINLVPRLYLLRLPWSQGRQRSESLGTRLPNDRPYPRNVIPDINPFDLKLSLTCMKKRTVTRTYLHMNGVARLVLTKKHKKLGNDLCNWDHG